MIAYLGGLARFPDQPASLLPDMLLLDLEMPFKNGFEVLAWIQAQALENLTVVVLTDSHEEPTARAVVAAVAAVKGCEILRWRQETASSWSSFSTMSRLSSQLKKHGRDAAICVSTPKAKALSLGSSATADSLGMTNLGANYARAAAAA